MSRISKISVLKQIYAVVFVVLIAGCSLEKESAINRGLQNLTARYNLLFNANELLRLKQESYAASFVDSYNEILSVYQDTTVQSNTPDKDLEDVKLKANKIITLKEQSHYLGDAYLVLGKAYYLSGDYFQAIEFFNYVGRSFGNKPELVQQSLFWKARAMMYLNQYTAAKLVIDTAIQSIKPKKKTNIADIYATKLQYDITKQNYIEAESTGKLAIKYCRNKAQRLRWTFIVAQLQELNNEKADAVKNYNSISSSNAPFEMAFNAELNSIRITDPATNKKKGRIELLTDLMKSDNNKDFIDQIYYQIATLYQTNKDIDNAIKNYRLSVRNSRKNQNQKGLSYLRLADIFFKNKEDYIGAKKYYDSTLFNLSPNYPNYLTVQKKSNNLQLLADRFGVISREDTLQVLARLDEPTRAKRIDAIINKIILQQQEAQGDANATTSSVSVNSFGNSSFYFYNANAVSQGFSDFKKKWGNRKLEDNWRRSNKAKIVDETVASGSQSIDPDAPADPAPSTVSAKTSFSAGKYRQQLIKDLPLTPELLQQSNLRLYNAYFDIAGFYRDILGDKKEAITTYEFLLNRFPNSTDKPALYYNLYRLYSDSNNPEKANEYKSILLKDYAETAFAKIIIDPEYGKKIADANAGLNTSYNQIYDTYTKKKYKQAIASIDSLSNLYPNNKLSAQLAYLRAISSGHLEKLPQFKDDLTKILNKYPDDRLITPLVKQHLAYINTHQAEMAAGQFALTNNAPNDTSFKNAPTLEEQIAAYNSSQLVQQVAQKRINPITKQPEIDPYEKNKPTKPDVNKKPANNNVAKAVPSLFSMRDSTNYYFVINVNTATTNYNLSSSRFGIGQFNRANFEENGIAHWLINAGDDNQLIYVGRFYSLNAVKAYARAIVPLLPDIMKVPKDKYSFFIITQENLNKLTTKKLLDSYIDYYQKNY